MSGHEWAPEPGELRGDDRPLSPAAGPAPGFARPDPGEAVDEDGPGPDAADDDAPESRRRAGFRFRLPRFRARRDGDAVAEEGEVEVIAGPDSFDAEPGPDEGGDGADAPRRRRPFRIALPRFRRPPVAAGDDADPDVATAEGSGTPGPDGDDEAPAPARRFPAFGLSREARVGLAAALSFAILVTVWITNKGRALPQMKIPGESDAQAEPKAPQPVVASAEGPGPAKPDAAPPATAPAADAAGGGPAHGPDRGPVDAGSFARSEAVGKAALPEAAPGPIAPVAPASEASPMEFPSSAPTTLASATPTPPASPAPAPAEAEASTTPGLGDPPPADAGSAVELPPSPSADPTPPAGPGDAPQGATPTMPEPMPTPAAETAVPAMQPSGPPAAPPDLPTMPAPGEPAPAVAATPGAGEPAPIPSPADPPPTPEADPPAPAPSIAPAPAPAVVPEPGPAPAVVPEPGPAPAVVPEPGPAPTEPRPAAPVPSNKVPPLDPVTPRSPGPGADPSAMSTTPAGAGAPPDAGDGWVSIKGSGRRVVISTPSSDGIGLAAASGALGGAAAIADGPAPREDEAVRDQVEPRLHRVRPGENFWTISRLYYGTGRYYRALHAANAREVPDIRELYVGTVIRLPSPEMFDRSLVEPPSRERVADKSAGASVSRTSNPGATGGGADLAVPTRPATRRRPEVEAPEQPPARPVYKVRGAHETLRGIARDTLDNPRRYREILNLNRSILDEDTVLKPGQTITLPADAVIGRRGR